jgi:hypothetical protein
MKSGGIGRKLALITWKQIPGFQRGELEGKVPLQVQQL